MEFTETELSIIALCLVIAASDGCGRSAPRDASMAIYDRILKHKMSLPDPYFGLEELKEMIGRGDNQ